MYNLIFLLLTSFLLYNNNTTVDEVGIVGEYEWKSTFYSNNIFEGVHFIETNGSLIITSSDQEVYFTLTENEEKYSFKLMRDSVFDYNKAKAEYEKLRITSVEGNSRLKEIFNLLSYGFLLRETHLNEKVTSLTQRVLVLKLKKGIHKFKKNEDKKKITFEIFDKWEETNKRDRVSNVIGVFNLNANGNKYLECIFELHNDRGCCINERKGVLTINKIK